MSDELPDPPTPGETISAEDMDMIFEAVRGRQEKHPDEPASLSFFTVLSKIGRQFRPVECLEQEWTGLVRDIPKGEGGPSWVPKCPNGHEINPTGPALAIGWVEIE